MTEGKTTKAKRDAELEAELRAIDDLEFLSRMVTDTDISKIPARRNPSTDDRSPCRVIKKSNVWKNSQDGCREALTNRRDLEPDLTQKRELTPDLQRGDRGIHRHNRTRVARNSRRQIAAKRGTFHAPQHRRH